MHILTVEKLPVLSYRLFPFEMNTLVYLKALATVQGSGYSFKKTWLQSKMADLPESYTTNAHFTEVTLSMPIWYT